MNGDFADYFGPRWHCNLGHIIAAIPAPWKFAKGDFASGLAAKVLRGFAAFVYTTARQVGFPKNAHRRLILTDLKGIICTMSYKTLEVELENGRVHPAGAETLPDKAHALWTILSPQAVKPEEPAKSLGQAMRALGVMGRGEFTDLSTNPRHMDDFGK